MSIVQLLRSKIPSCASTAQSSINIASSPMKKGFAFDYHQNNIHKQVLAPCRNQIPEDGEDASCSLRHFEETESLLSIFSDYCANRTPYEEQNGESASYRTSSKVSHKVKTIKYEPKMTIKGQVLADFIVEFTLGAPTQSDLLER